MSELLKTRLNEYSRSRIVHALLEHGFEARILHTEKKAYEFMRRRLKKYLGKNAKMFIQCPSEWFRATKIINVKTSDTSYKFLITPSLTVPFNWSCETVELTPDELKLHNEIRTMKNEQKTIRRQIYAILQLCRTFKNVKERWPESWAIVKNSVPQPMILTPLPVNKSLQDLSKINQILKLPPKD